MVRGRRLRGGSANPRPDGLLHGEVDDSGDRPFFVTRLVWWIGAQIGLGLLPLGFAALNAGKAGWNSALAHGDVYLVAVVIMGAEVAEAAHLETTSRWRGAWRATIMVIGLLFCVYAAYLYGHLQGLFDSKGSNNPAPDSTGLYSYVLLGATVLVGISRNYLNHVEEVV